MFCACYSKNCIWQLMEMNCSTTFHTNFLIGFLSFFGLIRSLFFSSRLLRLSFYFIFFFCSRICHARTFIYLDWLRKLYFVCSTVVLLLLLPKQIHDQIILLIEKHKICGKKKIFLFQKFSWDNMVILLNLFATDKQTNEREQKKIFMLLRLHGHKIKFTYILFTHWILAT